ncbi:hypothetical protein INT48_006297 [Thamnidium elegans]|uniref:Uncharacterized protein n=1 Tax=Thamnidium elegans TaxID=101142 RepID=A0A8H7SQR8_9FUNG|nr:hypothetical protein INT48_006297 [Thamnidium elegans]
MFQPIIQPRSSAERDNSLLLHSVLKAASTDIAHRLLDYASLDKVDCEASCILIALSNHEPASTITSAIPPTNDLEPKKRIKEVTVQQDISTKDDTIIEKKDVSIEKEKAYVTLATDRSKTDPIMLLMAAAQVVDGKDYTTDKFENRKRNSSTYSIEEARRRDAYPNGRYYLKSDNKRIRTSPPTPAPTYKVDTWRKNHRSTQDQPTDSSNNSFSMQYHSMKQNPKVKQNALHTYITYMIYNDMIHGSSAATSSTITTSLREIPPSNNNSPWHRHDDRSIISRPLTAFLWNNENSSVNSHDNNNRKDMVILPPLSSNPRPSPSISTYDRLPPV